MKFSKILLSLFLCVMFLFSGCYADRVKIEEGEDTVREFFDFYISGKLTEGNISNYIVENDKTKDFISFLLSDNDELSVSTLRNQWGIEESVLSDEKMELMSNNALTERLKKISYKIEKTSTKAEAVSVKVKYSFPVVKGDLTSEEAKALIYSASGVTDAVELQRKFFEARKLPLEEAYDYEQEQFEKEFSEFIIENYVPEVLKKLIENAEIKDVEMIFNVKRHNGMILIDSVKVGDLK